MVSNMPLEFQLILPGVSSLHALLPHNHFPSQLPVLHQIHHQMQKQQPHMNSLTRSHNGRKTNHYKSFILYHIYDSIALTQH